MIPLFSRIKAGVLALLLAFSSGLHAQQLVKGKVTEAGSSQPLEGVTVTLLPSHEQGITDALGQFAIAAAKELPAALAFSYIGFETVIVPAAAFEKADRRVALTAHGIELAAITVSGHAGDQYKPISRTDIALRGVNNSQEILRIIPGVVISQHQGGGKAEQIFLRGFDADHGTDFRMEADGMPINMVSHAHGQGFADSHFIIPETIQSVDFRKGSFTADKGDFATAGFADFNTKNALERNCIKLESGMFNTWRALGMFNLLPRKARENQQSWYLASEYRYADAYFDHPQHFNRFNFFTKYSGSISAHQYLTLWASSFSSKWNASGQIPERAVNRGLIGFYGAIDPLEGGLSTRNSLNAQLVSAARNGDIIKNQLYYSRSEFDLHTNFTFFLADTVNGDEIRQQEHRHLLGYNGSYHHNGYAANMQLTTEAGLQLRLDKMLNSALSHTVNRYDLLNRVKLGDITQFSLSPYISETVRFNPHFSLNAGLRFDQFYHGYDNHLANDTILRRKGIYTAKAGIFSPKLSVYYHPGDKLQFYLTAGRGFHSNDTRAVVAEHGYRVLPGASAIDLGAVFKPRKDILINAAIWYIGMQQEFVYSGDGGDIAFNDQTKRLGIDYSIRYQPLPCLYVDMDINYAHGRTTGHAKGANYIPLAPVWTSTGSIAYTRKTGFNGSLRYRYIAKRPANEDYSLTAVGYCITDAVINYIHRGYAIGLIVNNVFNTKWKETQFATLTRLKDEPAPVNEICFTPGTPFAARISFTIQW